MRLENCNRVAEDFSRLPQAERLLSALFDRKHLSIEAEDCFHTGEFKIRIRFGWFYSRTVCLSLKRVRRDGRDINYEHLCVGRFKDIECYVYLGWREAFYCKVPNQWIQLFADRMMREIDLSQSKSDVFEERYGEKLVRKYSKRVGIQKKFYTNNVEEAWDFIEQNLFDAKKLSRTTLMLLCLDYRRTRSNKH